MIVTAMDIKGIQKVECSGWDIHFENLKSQVLSGQALEISKPYIADKSTSISDVNVQFSSTYDSILYSFDVTNDGELDAEISSIQISEPICSGIRENSREDEAIVCNNVKYNLAYVDGTKVEKGDSLKIGETKQMNLKLSYEGSEWPLNDVNISNLNIAIIYSQI